MEENDPMRHLWDIEENEGYVEYQYGNGIYRVLENHDLEDQYRRVKLLSFIDDYSCLLRDTLSENIYKYIHNAYSDI